MRSRFRLFAVMFAVAALLAPAALAQKGTPDLTHAPPGQQVKPPMTIAPATKPVTGVIQQDPAAMMAAARGVSAMMTCQGPLTLEILAKDPRDASKGVAYLLSFKEAASAAGAKPGECWRTGGFASGSGANVLDLNRGLKKGDILYEPPVVKCPAIKSMKIEGGKVTGVFNEVIYSDQMFRAASGPGAYSFDTRWLNFNGPGGQADGWGHYVAVPGDAVTPAVAGCRG